MDGKLEDNAMKDKTTRKTPPFDEVWGARKVVTVAAGKMALKGGLKEVLNTAPAPEPGWPDNLRDTVARRKDRHAR